MPLVSQFFGIKIYMYWAEHYPKHFHAEYGAYKVLINIEDGTVIKGHFPIKQLKLVSAWTEIHKLELLENWSSARNMGSILQIEPLK